MRRNGVLSRNLTTSCFRVIDSLFSQKEVLIVLISNRLRLSPLAFNNTESQKSILLVPGQSYFSIFRICISETELNLFRKGDTLSLTPMTHCLQCLGDHHRSERSCPLNRWKTIHIENDMTVPKWRQPANHMEYFSWSRI